MKRLSIVALLIVSLLAFAGAATAQSSGDLTVEWVEINGDRYNANEFVGQSATRIVVERGEEIEVEVKVRATADVEDAVIEVDMSKGHRYRADLDDLRSETKSFDLDENETVKKTLNGLKVPLRMDKDDIALRIKVTGGKNAPTYEQTFTLSVNGVDNGEAIKIKDVFLTPENSIKAGRYLFAQIKAKNYGDEDHKDLTYTFSIPALGLSDRDDANELEQERSRTSEDLLVQIPTCTEAGSYKWTATVEWDDGDEFVTSEGVIDVEASDACQAASGEDRTVISLGATSANVAAEQAATYPITITNDGTESKTYTVMVDGASEWASTRVDPTNTVVLEAGETQTLYVGVTPVKGAAAGQKSFTATVASGSEVLQQIALTATVTESGSKTTEALKIGLVVLVVLFVILALIVGFNKLKGSDEDEDLEEGQTYY